MEIGYAPDHKKTLFIIHLFVEYDDKWANSFEECVLRVKTSPMKSRLPIAIGNQQQKTK